VNDLEQQIVADEASDTQKQYLWLVFEQSDAILNICFNNGCYKSSVKIAH